MQKIAKPHKDLSLTEKKSIKKDTLKKKIPHIQKFKNKFKILHVKIVIESKVF